MSDDKVVYIKGASPEPQPAVDTGKIAMKDILRDAIKDHRAGKCRAVVIITIERDDASTWRIGGDFSIGEIVAALELTKIKLVTED